MAEQTRVLEIDEPDATRIEAVFAYGAHVSSKDAERLREEISKADVVLLEYLGWTPKALDHFRRVSEGTKDPETALREATGFTPNNLAYRFLRAELALLHGSQKAIGFIDVPRDHPLYTRYREFASYEPPEQRDFRGVLDLLKSRLKAEARLERERETYMRKAFATRVREIVETHPEMKTLERIRVLVPLGSTHSLVARDLLRAGYEATRILPTMPYRFSFDHEALRAYQVGKSVSDELAARVLLERLVIGALGDAFWHIADDSEKFAPFLRRILGRFSVGDVEALWERARKSEDTKAEVLASLREKGITLPQSEGQLDAFLKQAASARVSNSRARPGAVSAS